MVQKVAQLIEKAYRISGLYKLDRILEGSRQQEGLGMLNDLLDSFSSSPSHIAFYDILQFPVTSLKQEYVLSPSGGDIVSNRIVELKFCVLISAGVRYPVYVVQDTYYYKQIHYTSVNARPRLVFLQNAVNQSTINFFYKPDRDYTCEIKAKFVLSNLALNDFITNVPNYYIEYLKYSLARDLCIEYMPSNWTQLHEKKFEVLDSNLLNISDFNMSVIENQSLGSSRGSWMGTNLGVIL